MLPRPPDGRRGRRGERGGDGAHTFTIDATDTAGGHSTRTIAYRVIAPSASDGGTGDTGTSGSTGTGTGGGTGGGTTPPDGTITLGATTANRKTGARQAHRSRSGDPHA
ncbi:MAG: hypothetical protein ACYDHH_08685 [Solirubrobacteraceae bacterium]